MGEGLRVTGVRPVELRGFVTRYNVTSEQGTRRLVLNNRIGIGNGATVLNSGILPASGIFMENGEVIIPGNNGCQCVVLGGPHKFVAAVGSRHNEGYITRLIRGINRQICPVNELSGSDRNVLIFAGSNSFTGGIVRPGGGICGVCEMAIQPSVSRSRLMGLRANIRLSNEGATPTCIRMVRGRRNEMILRVVLRRNGGHRVEEVYRTIKLRITQLGHARVNKMGVNVLGRNS